MRRTLENLAALALAAPALALAPLAIAEEEGREGDVISMPDLAGDTAHRDFGGAPDGVEVVSGDEDEAAEAGEHAAAEGPAAPGRKHVVEKGDTLWDLSEKYLGSPWYWPKVWSHNPQIENPHWIYPGEEIRLGAGEAPKTEVAEAAPSDPSPLDGEPMEEDEVSVAGQIGFHGPGTIRVPAVGFATMEDLGRSGIVARSFEEKEMLHEGDKVYLDLVRRGGARTGDRLVIFREDREVRNPETGEHLGSMVRILGWVRILSADRKERYATGVIVQSNVEIERGDKVGPGGVALSRRVERTAATRSVSGTIAATLGDEVAELAQGHFVILDRGSHHGLERGNALAVIRATDGLEDDGLSPRFDADMPVENIGEVVVVDARERTSVALVVRSLRELRRGDRVQLRAATAAR
ncbi:MAG TPA: LysM peptidoglycan-binding domain-containing protein [Vulgatibacter sp.]